LDSPKWNVEEGSFGMAKMWAGLSTPICCANCGYVFGNDPADAGKLCSDCLAAQQGQAPNPMQHLMQMVSDGHVSMEQFATTILEMATRPSDQALGEVLGKPPMAGIPGTNPQALEGSGGMTPAATNPAQATWPVEKPGRPKLGPDDFPTEAPPIPETPPV